jgi:hypothetical protein
MANESNKPDNWCHTKCELIKVYFEWKIQIPFHEQVPIWNSMESSRFSAKETPSLDWFLFFVTECSPIGPDDIISIRLSPTKEREKADAGVTDVNVKLGIIQNSNEKIYFSDSENGNKNCFSLDWYELSDWIVDDSLTVFCEINQFHKETLASNSSGTTRAPVVESFLGGDQLFRNQLETFYEKNDVE